MKRKLVNLCLTLMIALIAVHAMAVFVRAEPQWVNVTVTIMRFIQMEDPDPAPFAGDGDYYAKVRIGSFPYENSGTIDDATDISPYWTFTHMVDQSLGSISVVIQIWDSDPWITAPDDIIDLNPTDNVQELVLIFNLLSGTWSGDVPANVGFSQGDGDREHYGFTEGGEQGKILFDISLSSNGDIDGDGIPDGVERFGVRDANGNLVADMAALGADPCRKTVAVEVDFMTGAPDGHTHQPSAAAIAEAVAAFNAAPVPAVVASPYPGFPTQPSGVNLIVDISNGITEQQVLGPADLPAVKAANFNPARQPYFHYSLWVHDHEAGSSSSGVAISAKDFIVSLGSWAGQTGTVREQSGTFIHELGHCLGLGHGGGDGINYKPNYLSVMNYAFQVVGLADTATGITSIDYSRVKLDDLDETALDENVGINDGTLTTQWRDRNFNAQGGVGNTPLDWTNNDFDGNGIRDDDNPVSVDINGDGVCVTAGNDGTLQTAPSGDDVVFGRWILTGPNRQCDSTAAGDDGLEPGGIRRAVGWMQPNILTGFEDWSHIQYRAAMAPTAGGVIGPEHNEITYEEALIVETFWQEFFNPDLQVTKSVDLADAIPSDTLTYSVTVENIGTGPATDIELVDDFPDGTSETRLLADMDPGDSTTETFTFIVPFPIADLTVLTNTATVTCNNILGHPEDDTSNNVATASTVVHTPVLDLSKTATPSVNAGEIITYTITYENTGSGDAEGAEITDTLPKNVYYSLALDQGAGPAPDSVTGNVDGTTTLTWLIGSLPSGSGVMTIEYTARPSLLFFAGESVTNDATLDFTDANGNDYPELTTSATTDIPSVPPGQDPKSLGFVRNHDEFWTGEILARIQATDNRFDGADGSLPDGQLSASEVEAILVPSGNQPKVLMMQLLTTYFNLATRQINADTLIDSRIANWLGLANVREAVEYAMNTLKLPVNKFTRIRYTNITLVLDEINNNISEIY